MIAAIVAVKRSTLHLRDFDRKIISTGTVVTRMWPGGPLRLQRSRRDFSRSYVCDGCQVPVVGVYRVLQGENRQEAWLCATCRDQGKLKLTIEDETR